jgi:hypothetical protein
MEIGEFLATQLGSVGAWNCSTLVADWLIQCGYPDYAETFRDLTDPEECRIVAEARGGLAELWEGHFGGAVPWADAPWEAGDIAVVAIGPHEAGAIFTGERWALRCDHGLAFASPGMLDVKRGWRP